MGTHKYGYVLIDSSAASPHYCVRHPSNSCWVIAFLVKMASLSVFKLLVVALLLSTLLSVDCSARLNSRCQKRVPIKPSSKGNNKFSNVNLPTDTSTVGFDTVASLNQTVLTCLVAQASVATFQAVNGLDIVAAVNATAAAARSAGFTTVDALLSPCPLCSVNAPAQASRFAQYVTKSKLSVDNYWVSVTNQKWSNDTSTNTAFLQIYLTSILSLPKSGSVGILTSSPIWSRVTGGSTSFTNISGSTIMLWYATVDNQPNYNDFKPFGGWSTPTRKKYVLSLPNNCTSGKLGGDYVGQYVPPPPPPPSTTGPTSSTTKPPTSSTTKPPTSSTTKPPTSSGPSSSSHSSGPSSSGPSSSGPPSSS